MLNVKNSYLLFVPHKILRSYLSSCLTSVFLNKLRMKWIVVFFLPVEPQIWACFHWPQQSRLFMLIAFAGSTHIRKLYSTYEGVGRVSERAREWSEWAERSRAKRNMQAEWAERCKARRRSGRFSCTSICVSIKIWYFNSVFTVQSDLFFLVCLTPLFRSVAPTV